MYPNQRTIEVNKAKCSKENTYTVNSLEAVDKAAKLLTSKGGFKLWYYIAKNQDGHRFDLSSSAFMAWSGLSRDAYTTAFKELVKHRFLIQKPDEKNKFEFYDEPQIDKLPKSKPKASQQQMRETTPDYFSGDLGVAKIEDDPFEEMIQEIRSMNTTPVKAVQESETMSFLKSIQHPGDTLFQS